LKVDTTIAEIQDQFSFDDDKIIRHIFDKLESERSLIWIQIARTYANRLNNEIKFAKEVF
jgi:hypothetical protein